MQDKVLQSLKDAMKGKKLIRMCDTLEQGLEQIVMPVAQEIWYKYPSLDEDIIKPHVDCYRPFSNRARDRKYTYDTVIWKILADDYLKSCKDELLFFCFRKSTNLAEACEQYGFKELMPDYKLYKDIQEKNLLHKFGVVEGCGAIPSLREKVQEMEYDQVAKKLGNKFVVQYSVDLQGYSSSGGRDTYVVENKEDFEEVKKKDYPVPARITRYISGIDLSVNAVSTVKGTIALDCFTQIIGAKEITDHASMYCGVDFSMDIPEEVRTEVKRITKAVGNELYKKQYRGIFGIDFLLENETSNVYVLEINPRFTRATNMLAFLLKKKNLLPHIALHFSEYLDCFPEGFTAEEYEEEIKNSLEGGLIYVRSRENETVQAIEGPKPGIYELKEDGTPGFLKEGYAVDQLTDKNQLLITHAHPHSRNIPTYERMFLVHTLQPCLAEEHHIREKFTKAIDELYGQFKFVPEDTYNSDVPYQAEIQ